MNSPIKFLSKKGRSPVSKRHFQLLLIILRFWKSQFRTKSTSVPILPPIPQQSPQPHSAGRFLHSGRNDDVAPRPRSRSRPRHQARANSATARSPASPIAAFLSLLSLFCFFRSSSAYSSKDFLTVSKAFFLSTD